MEGRRIDAGVKSFEFFVLGVFVFVLIIRHI